MRRVVAILLLAFLPIHFGWAAVSVYCGHESGKAAQHVGHHEHQHEDAKQDSDPSGMSHPDCGACHAGCSAVMCSEMFLPISPGASAARAGSMSALPAPTSVLERPNWLRSA